MKHLARLLATTLFLLLCFAAWTGGQQRPATRPRPTPVPKQPVVPQVTAFKVDGTTVRGVFTAADPESVTLTPQARPNAKEAPAPITVAWKEIRSLSNGFTQAKAVTQWKQANRENLCETCRGERVVFCPTCKGTNHDPASAKDCTSCVGELLVDCKAPKCEGGKIPCTNHCLQLTEGRWVTRSDGKKWRDFPLGRGVATFSDGHLGHVIKIDRKAGTAEDVGTCPVCGGTTKLDCPVCHGTAKAPCPTCVARKEAAACTAGCDGGMSKCATCKGTGLKPGESPVAPENPGTPESPEQPQEAPQPENRPAGESVG